MQRNAEARFAHHTTTPADYDPADLLTLKEQRQLTVSVVLTVRDDDRTVGAAAEILRLALVEQVTLVDEVLLMDSSSVDATVDLATAAGPRVVHVDDVLPAMGAGHGRGETLWNSLWATTGDLVVFLDVDPAGIDPAAVVGLLGPLLTDPAVGYVKGFHDRPLIPRDDPAHPGHGQVPELLVRSMIEAFWPQLSAISQPLSGEHAGHRELFEAVPFAAGHGVDLGLLLDVVQVAGIDALAQVDLGVRPYRHPGSAALGTMTGQVLQAALSRVPPTASRLRAVRGPERGAGVVMRGVGGSDRPPMRDVRAALQAAGR